jgi:Lrp/AsnC family leucine-responsive transcriptional regulator
MREIDDTDLNILRLLLEEGRRPYSEIADRVGVSPPTVSDRVERLQDLGVIRRFTLDVDRSTLDDGVEVLVDVYLKPGSNGDVKRRLATVDAVEHVFATADGRLTCKAVVQDGDVRPLLNEAVDMDVVERFEVDLLTDDIWVPYIGDGSLALDCDECGDAVDTDGVSGRDGDDSFYFCSDSCRTRFEDRRTTVTESV